MAAPGQAGRRPPLGPADRRGAGGAGLTEAAPWLIRRLTQADLPAYRPLRLAALRDHPEAFGSSYEEEQHDSPGTEMARLIAAPPGVTLGAFVAARLVATVSMAVSPRVKQRHKGHLTAVYVVPEWRRTGLAAALLADIIRHARGAGLIMLTLSVTVGNEPAHRLYLRAGFRRYGVEPNSLRIGDTLYDETSMALKLD